MNNEIKTIVTFVAGALTGAGIAWKFLENRKNEEIEAIRNDYKEYYDALEANHTISDVDDISYEYEPTEEDKIDYASIIKVNDYKTTEKEIAPGESEDVTPMIYSISSDEYDCLEGHVAESLTYYDDGILTDENDLPLSPDEIARQIGFEMLDLFDRDTTAIYIRNEILNIDYEIIKVDSRYEDGGE